VIGGLKLKDARARRLDFLLFLEKLVNLSHKLAHIFELEIDGGKTQIGYLINPFDFRKKDFPDRYRIQLTLGTFLNALLHPVDDFLQLRETDRPFFACLKKAVEYFVPVESFSPAVLFHNHVRDFIAALIAGKAAAAVEALAAAADRVSVAAFSRIYNTVLQESTKGALHGIGLDVE